MSSDIIKRIIDLAARADPYPVYAELYDRPVVEADNGTFVVGGYDDVWSLLHDWRLSSDPSNQTGYVPSAMDFPLMLTVDAPQHDTLRRLATKAFGPPCAPGLVLEQEPSVVATIDELIGAFGPGQADVVDELAYPLPVSAICRLLGVPREDEPQFRAWGKALIGGLDQLGGVEDQGLVEARDSALMAMFGYLSELIARLREHPDGSMFARLALDQDQEHLDDVELAANGILLLVAGHESTVNQTANGMLTLLRWPEQLAMLRSRPERMAQVTEELLRFEPPLQYLPDRFALEDIELGGTTITKGSAVALMLAAANRDPRRFDHPDVFDPDRPDNQHLSFGGGIHYCFGAPLARIEIYRALGALVGRLVNPRLLEDPPPYRTSPVLRGPLHLRIAYDGVLGPEASL
ncbi:MAG: cytochrome P450 [Acidimicrobiales bacterium]